MEQLTFLEYMNETKKLLHKILQEIYTPYVCMVSKLQFKYKIINSELYLQFTYIDKQGYKQVITKVFNFVTEKITLTTLYDVVSHLRTINPHYFK